MNNLNSVLLEGNLVKVPELSRTSSGTPVCRLTIATNRYYKINDDYQQEVSFFEITTWNKLAQTCSEYLTKGRGIRVIGRLKQERWKSADGKSHSRIIVADDHIEFRPQYNRSEDNKKELEVSS